jgi:hypothetical protein
MSSVFENIKREILHQITYFKSLKFNIIVCRPPLNWQWLNTYMGVHYMQHSSITKNL